MKITIVKGAFCFSASHQLDYLPEGHKCGRLHGHNYSVEVELSGEIDRRGFVRDYGDLASIQEYLDTRWDHRHLNDVLGSAIATTAENLAVHLLSTFRNEFPDLVAVRVSETPRTWAEARA